MKLLYRQNCRKCGHECEPGEDVVMKRGPSPWPGIEGRWQVVACPKCALVSHVAEVAPRKEGISMAESMRRDAIRRKKARKHGQ